LRNGFPERELCGEPKGLHVIFGSSAESMGKVEGELLITP